jgi:hypothetical protein
MSYKASAVMCTTQCTTAMFCLSPSLSRFDGVYYYLQDCYCCDLDVCLLMIVLVAMRPLRRNIGNRIFHAAYSGPTQLEKQHHIRSKTKVCDVRQIGKLLDFIEGPVESTTPTHSVDVKNWRGHNGVKYLFMYCLHVRCFLTWAPPSWFPTTCWP